VKARRVVRRYAIRKYSVKSPCILRLGSGWRQGKDSYCGIQNCEASSPLLGTGWVAVTWCPKHARKNRRVLEAMFSVRFVPRLYYTDPLPLRGVERESWDSSYKSGRLVWDGRQPARTLAQKQRNVHCWKTLPSKAVKTVTENPSLRVTVICKV
jgi:hypothetical protein